METLNAHARRVYNRMLEGAELPSEDANYYIFEGALSRICQQEFDLYPQKYTRVINRLIDLGCIEKAANAGRNGSVWVVWPNTEPSDDLLNQARQKAKEQPNDKEQPTPVEPKSISNDVVNVLMSLIQELQEQTGLRDPETGTYYGTVGKQNEE